MEKKSVVQVKSTTSGSSREQSDDDEAEGETETNNMEPTDAKRVRSFQSTEQIQGVLNLIDLASSKRLSKSGSTSDWLKETYLTWKVEVEGDIEGIED
ncbi:Kinesin-like protein KIN-14M [Camellia lanceoleosa]|uniref:Kinesin-like protein KIN-14M n=1 Tax=Camellia lanceoleosa TaxID=1840588 RepID=A0ACC0FVL2_9ERIC|nr:Kinesin-like protein KIN-14M [Camellia lanceoleosa]